MLDHNLRDETEEDRVAGLVVHRLVVGRVGEMGVHPVQQARGNDRVLQTKRHKGNAE